MPERQLLTAIACMLEANPRLTPLLIRQILMSTAEPVAGAPRDRQGAGALAAGAAVARALAERHGSGGAWEKSPAVRPEGVVFRFHDDEARGVEVCGCPCARVFAAHNARDVVMTQICFCNFICAPHSGGLQVEPAPDLCRKTIPPPSSHVKRGAE